MQNPDAVPSPTSGLAAQDGGVVILSDELNHASIVDGARLGRRGGSRLLVYRHNDLAHLEQLLATQCPPGAQPVRASVCRAACLALPCCAGRPAARHKARLAVPNSLPISRSLSLSLDLQACAPW